MSDHELQFSNLHEVGPIAFQDGYIFLRGFGCPGCGNGFWIEADSKRVLDPGHLAACPHCGQVRAVPAR